MVFIKNILPFIMTIPVPLKSRYKRRVQAASAYAKTIDNFDDLIDPPTLYRFFLGPSYGNNKGVTA